TRGPVPGQNQCLLSYGGCLLQMRTRLNCTSASPVPRFQTPGGSVDVGANRLPGPQRFPLAPGIFQRISQCLQFQHHDGSAVLLFCANSTATSSSQSSCPAIACRCPISIRISRGSSPNFSAA